MDCLKCWDEYPARHKGCGGIVHAHMVDCDWDSIFMQYFCEKCGELSSNHDDIEVEMI